MNDVTIKGQGVKAAPSIGAAATVEQHKPTHYGELLPDEPAPRARPVLPIQLRGSGLTSNLPYDEAVERYGLWKCKVLKTVWCHGRLLRPGDTCELDGATLQLLVGQGKASVTDPRLAEENSIIDQAVALGLPTKIRELASFAQPKKNKWPVRPEANE